jgi:glycosyltransferase involved in cell wall biosynthesis
LDTVIDGQTGLFFSEQTPESLKEAIRRLDSIDFDPRVIRRHAEGFGVQRFKRELWSYVEGSWREFARV